MNTSIMGIYKITNKVNNKIYIGSSVDIDRRWKQHIRELKKGKHINKHLQRSWNKYGEENFDFNIVQIIQNEADLQLYEQRWINTTKCYDGNIGYNLSIDSTRPLINPEIIQTHLNCNLVYRDHAKKLIKLNLKTNEKLVYYVLRDIISYPSNSILINNEIPTMSELESIVDLKERTIRKALKSLEQKKLIKIQKSGVRNCIYFNPYYIKSGKNIAKEVIRMFELDD